MQIFGQNLSKIDDFWQKSSQNRSIFEGFRKILRNFRSREKREKLVTRAADSRAREKLNFFTHLVREKTPYYKFYL